MKLNITEIQGLFAAHDALGGYVRRVSIAGEERDVIQPYVFSTECTLALLANRRVLRQAVVEFQEARNDLIRQISGGEKITGAEQTERFAPAMQALIDAQHDVDLRTVKIADLNPGPVNPIPINVLDALEAITEE